MIVRSVRHRGLRRLIENDNPRFLRRNLVDRVRKGTVKLSRIRPFCGRILLDQRLRINDLAGAAGGENAAKLLNLTVPQGELFPRVGFIVTSMSLPSRSLVRFCNKRGTAEQWIKEGKQATHWTRLSCHRSLANEVRLQLSVLAYNLGNLWRRLGLPNRIKSWSLTSLQHRLMKTGGRLNKHARYYWLLLAEGHLNRRLFGDMLRRTSALPVPSG